MTDTECKMYLQVLYYSGEVIQIFNVEVFSRCCLVLSHLLLSYQIQSYKQIAYKRSIIDMAIQLHTFYTLTNSLMD